ncbi:hypothetical protein [Microbispora bryophytorum]|uniref:hypothetical protein n=1 Tax=Microbispora bryophytorum TaxID=1460882 RepID=UPI0034008229
MSDYTAGTTLNALDCPPAVSASDATQINNPTNRSYIAGTPTVSVTFIAPTSGRVWIIVGGGVGNGSGSNRIFLAPEVRLNNSSGSVIVAPSAPAHGWGAFKGANAFYYGSRRTMLTGLTPGQTYYARVMYECINDGGTDNGDIAYREIIVAPAT